MDETKSNNEKEIHYIKHDVDIKKWVDDTFPAGHKRTVHVHFLDFGHPPDNGKDTQTQDNTPKQMVNVTKLVGNMAKHLKALSQCSDGVIMTCGGDNGQHNIMSKIVPKLSTDDSCDEYDLNSCRSLVVVLGEPGKELIKEVHHRLQMNEKGWPPIKVGKARQVQEIREAFISQMTSLPRNSLLKKQDEATAVVCVLMDSGEESLKTALMAIESDIPLIVFKGGDVGLNYLVTLHERMKIRWERRRVGKEIRLVAVPRREDTDSKPPKSEELLNKLKQHLPFITIYRPEDDKSKRLDAVILEALIINKKENEMSSFLKSLTENQNSVEKNVNFINNKDLQWDYFIRSLKNGEVTAVKAFLGCLQLDCDDFHFGKLLELYDSKKKNFLYTWKPIKELTDINPKKGPTEDNKAERAVKSTKKFYMARRDIYKYLQKPALFPLPCEGIRCQRCTFTLNDLKDKGNIKDEASSERWQTCLHPVQELFLWSLLFSNSDITTALWEYTKDRMAAALFASAVYYGIAKREKKRQRMDNSFQLKEDSRRFEQLAVLTLTSSTEMGESKTNVMLRKPCPWWSPLSRETEVDQSCFILKWWSSDPREHFTVVDVALQTQCKPFIAQDMSQQLMSQRWLNIKLKMTRRTKSTGKNIEETQGNDERGLQQPEVTNNGEQTRSIGNAHTNKEQLPTYDTSEEEDEGVNDSKQSVSCGTGYKSLTRQNLKSTKARYVVCIVWQLAFILLFSYVLLMGLTGTIHGANLALIVWVGDILVEEIRQWQSTKVRPNSQKSDSRDRNILSRCRAKCKEYFRQGWNILDTFSIVLFVIGTVLAFFKNNRLAHDAGRLLLAADIVLFILRFLQVFVVFKKLGLWLIMAKNMTKDTMCFMGILLSIAYGYAVASESLLKEDETPPDYWYKLPRKAFFSIFGDFGLDDIDNKQTASSTWKWVPVFLGVFVVMTNVLLLNLLIARLNSLYSKMENMTLEYQSWQKCQAVLEFEHRSWLPPPFNIVCAVWALMLAPTRLCCCRKRLSSTKTAGQGCKRKQNLSGQEAVPLRAMEDDSVTCKNEMHGTCLRISVKKNDADKTEIMVTTKTALNLTIKDKEYTLTGRRPLLLWKADPAEVREIKYGTTNRVVNTEYPEYQKIYKQYSDLDKFEKVQAEWAITQLGKAIPEEETITH